VTTQKTRCPYCSSVFAVSNAQLAIRDGYTRCGKCFQVFKADDYLLASTPIERPTTSDNSQTLIKSHDKSHIVDLHKIDSSKTRGFDKALDSFLEQKKLPLPSIIDFEPTKKTKIDLTVLPNEHPEPRESTESDPDAYLATALQEPAEQLSHEFNEAWLTETATPTNPLAQPTAVESENSKDKNSTPESKSESTSGENERFTDDDLTSYLNQNSVPSTNIKPKSERAIASLNDFHANQRSKKNAKSVPMHISIAKRNKALDRLTARKKWFTLDFFHILGWSIASLLMVLLLIGQYIFFNFDRLAANDRYQPVMHKACLMLGCDVPLIDLSKIKLTNVLAGRFQPSPHDSTIFTATMTNLAEESQPYPNLRLIVLKDRKVISGRVIHPAEYLKNGYSVQARISVNHPTAVEFVLKIQRDEIPVFALDPVK